MKCGNCHKYLDLGVLSDAKAPRGPICYVCPNCGHQCDETAVENACGSVGDAVTADDRVPALALVS